MGRKKEFACSCFGRSDEGPKSAASHTDVLNTASFYSQNALLLLKGQHYILTFKCILQYSSTLWCLCLILSRESSLVPLKERPFWTLSLADHAGNTLLTYSHDEWNL